MEKTQLEQPEVATYQADELVTETVFTQIILDS